MSCSECPLSGGIITSGARDLTGKEADHNRVKYLFVAAVPGSGDERTRHLYSGAPFARMQRVLEILGLPLDTFAVTTITRCRRDSGKAHLRDLRACKTRFLLEVSALDPEKVFTLGAQAWQVLGDGSKLTQSKLRQVPMTWEQEALPKDLTVAALIDPRATLMDPAKVEQFAEDLDAYLQPEKDETIRWVWQEKVPESLSVAKEIIFDIETDGLKLGKEIQMIGYKLPHWKSVRVSPLEGNEQMWRGILLCPGQTLMGHNVKYDISRLAFALKVPTILCKAKCSMIQHFVLAEDLTARSLDRLSKLYTNFIDFKTETRDTWESGEKVDLMALRKRNAYDVAATQIVYDRLTDDLKTADEYSPRVDWLYGELIPFVSWMEQVGVAVDGNEVVKQRRNHKGQITRLRNLLDGIAPGLNPGSPQQVGKLLYEQHGLKPEVMTDKGAPSTSKEALDALVEKGDMSPQVDTFVEHLLAWRKHRKILTGYLNQFVDPHTEKPNTDMAFPEFFLVRGEGQADEALGGTVTGRLAIKKPALQTITNGPLRRIFRSRWKTGKLWCVDAAQAELKVLAVLSRCAALLEVFRRRGDLHQWTADLAGTSRKWGKTINFASVYGCSKKKLIELGLTPRKAQEVHSILATEWKELYDYLEKVEWDAADFGRVSTPYGAVRRLPLARLQGPRGQAARRQAGNFVAQRPGSDLVQLLGSRAMRFCERDQFMPILSVHDEIIFDSRMNKTATMLVIKSIVDGWRDYVEEGLGWCPDVPMEWEVTCGPNWGDQEVVDVLVS